LSKLKHNINCGKSSPQIWASFVIKIAQSKQTPIERKFAQSGTNVMILKIFSPKNWLKNWRFYTKQS
jgi:hypothetical protein